jgi:NTP pyrophosphatase (non-canonical NTP hydrolase)
MGELDFSDYQRRAARTGRVVEVNHPIVYPTLGLTNEAGEVAGKVKKIFRDRGGVVSDGDRSALTLELGDVLWYLAELCTQLGISLDDVAAANLRKLEDRSARGKLSGDGDYR